MGLVKHYNSFLLEVFGDNFSYLWVQEVVVGVYYYICMNYLKMFTQDFRTVGPRGVASEAGGYDQFKGLCLHFIKDKYSLVYSLLVILITTK